MAALQTPSSSKPHGVLDTALAEVAARVRRQRLIRGSVRGLTAALVLDLAFALLSRADLLPGSLPVIPALLFLAALGAILGGFLASRPLTPMDAAHLAEAQLPLKERLSSALEFDQSSSLNPLLALQHADADTHARALDARQVAPRRAPRELWLAALLLLALALILTLPNLPFALTPAQRAERQDVQAAGRQLQDAAHAVSQQADAQHNGAAKRQAQAMEALGRRMSQGHMDRAQALAAVSQQEQQLAGAAGTNASSGDPGQAAKSLAGALSSPSPASSKGVSAKPGASSPHASPAKTGTGVLPAAAQHAAGQTRSRPSVTAPSKPAAQSKPGAMHPSSPPHGAHVPQSAHGSEAAAGTQAGGSPPPSGAPGMRQALEKAHRQLAGTSPASAQAPSASSSAPPSGQASSPSSSPARAGKPNSTGKPNNTAKPNGPGQPSHTAPGGAVHSAGKGQNGSPGQGKAGRQSAGTPGNAASQPASGGGAGSAAKMPFHAALPPLTASKNQSLYLGAPHQKLGAGASLRRQPGRPDSPAPPSRVPYTHALSQYRKSAESALDQEQVPPSQRAVVRSYFNSLQPAK